MPMSADPRIPCPGRRAAVLAIVLAAVLALGPAGQAQAAPGDCPLLFDLYRGCHGRGVQADSSLACLEASFDAMTRTLAKLARKNPQGAQVLVDLVCGTGCEDAVSLREPATRPEFTEAFCD